MTEKLYQKDVYLKTCEATVTGVCEEKGVTLSATIFFPEGGGQGSDIGTLTAKDGAEFAVTHVSEKDGELYHRLQPKSGADSVKATAATTLPEVDEEVTLTLNWDQRFENMQRHCGEHILSGRFFALFGAQNKGFHMGDHYMTIDMLMPEGEDGSRPPLTLEMALNAEQAANEIIWQDLPVHVDYFDTHEEAAAMPLRKELTIGEDISVVTIGDKTRPADCCACCGSHPSGTAQVGLLKIYKVEKNKEFWRIYFDAGKKAMDHYDEIATVVSELSATYSAPLENPALILDKIAIEKDKQYQTHQALNDLRKGQVKRICEAAILEAHRDLQSWSQSPTTVTPSGISAKDFDSANKIMADRLIGTVFIRFVEDATVLLYSDGDFDCGQAVKDFAPRYDGKGGGSDIAARAMFPDAAKMDAFLAAFGCRADLML